MAKFKIVKGKPAIKLTFSEAEFEAVYNALIGAGILAGAWNTISAAREELVARKYAA